MGLGMSLKAFHVVFIIVSTILAVGFGIWAIRDYRARSESASLVVGAGSLLAALALVWYGRWFLRKLKRVGYL